MRTQGRVVRWDDARGFGFIRGAAGSQEVFFHARDFRSAPGQPPGIGLQVAFEQVEVGGKGPRAMAVQPLGAAMQKQEPRRRTTPRQASRPGCPPRPSSGAAWFLPLAAAYAAVLGWAVWTHRLPWWVLAASLALNLGTFFVYWQDKYAAENGRWRTPEDSLHLWSLAGGWGGAWFAQQALRHKSRKASFRQVYGITVLAHCGAVGYWLYRAAA
jgi:uncharacterized membrane protein YsdA (DUF1294 family)/cold shock CspA family protein